MQLQADVAEGTSDYWSHLFAQDGESESSLYFAAWWKSEQEAHNGVLPKLTEGTKSLWIAFSQFSQALGLFSNQVFVCLQAWEFATNPLSVLG